MKYVILLLCVVGIMECISYLFLTFVKPEYSKVREFLIDHNKQYVVKNQRVSSHPYLLYIPTPNYKEEDMWHNSRGWRGNPVEIDKNPETLRILFMGGSTTYNYAIYNNEKTYPEQIKKIISEKLPLGRYKDVEVINSGLPWGTSAELLTHYAFKFSYFSPDIVVVNTGGNDADALGEEHIYLPDYSHVRQAINNFKPLEKFGKLVLTSRTLSALVIPVIYGLNPKYPEFHKQGAWVSHNWLQKKVNIQEELRFNGFYNNLSKLIRLIRFDGAKVLLVPYRENPESTQPRHTQDWHLRNEKSLYKIAKEFDIPVAPFPASVISPKNWTDFCHVSEEGALEKAQHIAPYILKLVDQ